MKCQTFLTHSTIYIDKVAVQLMQVTKFERRDIDTGVATLKRKENEILEQSITKKQKLKDSEINSDSNSDSDIMPVDT